MHILAEAWNAVRERKGPLLTIFGFNLLTCMAAAAIIEILALPFGGLRWVWIAFSRTALIYYEFVSAGVLIKAMILEGERLNLTGMFHKTANFFKASGIKGLKPFFIWQVGVPAVLTVILSGTVYLNTMLSFGPMLLTYLKYLELNVNILHVGITQAGVSTVLLVLISGSLLFLNVYVYGICFYKSFMDIFGDGIKGRTWLSGLRTSLFLALPTPLAWAAYASGVTVLSAIWARAVSTDFAYAMLFRLAVLAYLVFGLLAVFVFSAVYAYVSVAAACIDLKQKAAAPELPEICRAAEGLPPIPEAA